MAAHEPRVVAELGRPETVDETAARKASNSKNYREAKTLKNLAVALGLTLLVLLVIVLIVPRSSAPIEPDINVSAVAEQAQLTVDEPLATPSMSDSWRANAAEIRTNNVDGVVSWYAGYLTPSDEYIGMYQGIDANPTWVAELLARTPASGAVAINGAEWTIYDNRSTGEDVGNARYGLTTEIGGSTFVLIGTATDTEFAELAATITADATATP